MSIDIYDVIIIIICVLFTILLTLFINRDKISCNNNKYKFQPLENI